MRIGTVLVIAALASVVSAEPRVRVVRIEVPPTLDGDLSDVVWQRPPQIDGLQEVEPVPGATPSQRTQMWILTTPTHLYIGVRCHDSNPEGIVAQRMFRDDDLIPDDRVGITIGPFGDRRNGYFFQVNPNGVRRDVLIEGTAFEANWNGFWQAKTQVDAGGWSAEFAIPYQTFSFDPNQDVWDFNVHRVVRRIGERTRWSNTEPARAVLNVGIAGYLEGMTGLEQGLGIEVVPSLTARYIVEDADGEDDWEVDPSGDLFYRFTPSLTGALTANTDFGETEADLRQLNLSRFDLFFPERRDFFLEDGLIFDFGDLVQNGRPFFSRRIGLDEDGERVDILGAAKLTGRVGPVKIGALHAETDGHGSVSRQSLTVIRPAINVFGESTLGAIVTNGNPSGHPDNTLVGADFLYFDSEFVPGRALEGTLWFQRSFSRDAEPGAGSDGGDEYAFGATLDYPNDEWNWRLAFQELQEDFVPGLGFANRVGVRDYDARLRYRNRWQGWLRTLDNQARFRLVTDRRGTVESGRLALTPIDVSSEVGDTLALVYRHDFERPEAFEIAGIPIAAGRYHFDEGEVQIVTAASRPLAATVLGAFGSFFDGYRTVVNVELAWRPSKHWVIAPEYRFRDLHMPAGKKEIHLARLRVNLQFTPDLSFVVLTQWDDIADTIGVNARFRWIIEDGRELFIVVNQNLDSRSERVDADRIEPLVKLEWAFRF